MCGREDEYVRGGVIKRAFEFFELITAAKQEHPNRSPEVHRSSMRINQPPPSSQATAHKSYPISLVPVFQTFQMACVVVAEGSCRYFGVGARQEQLRPNGDETLWLAPTLLPPPFAPSTPNSKSTPPAPPPSPPSPAPLSPLSRPPSAAPTISPRGIGIDLIMAAAGAGDRQRMCAERRGALHDGGGLQPATCTRCSKQQHSA